MTVRMLQKIVEKFEFKYSGTGGTRAHTEGHRAEFAPKQHRTSLAL